MFNRKKEMNKTKPPLNLEYYNDETLFIPKKYYNDILSSIKNSKLKEIALLDYSITNLKTQLLIVQKMMSEKTNDIENSKKEMIDMLKREINPDLLCQICFERRVNLVLTPCGHTFCDKCFGNNTHCFNCRGDVSSAHKIFFN
jgi:hypothetical protein